MNSKLFTVALLVSNSFTLSLTDSSDQRLKQHADDAMAYVNAISSGKKVVSDGDEDKTPAEDLDPNSPLFYAQEHDEIVKGYQHTLDGDDESKKR
jgi:hypothetical protein